jgi:hypothetical protein
MNERPKAAAEAVRRQRLSAALRENLKRRKAQLKGRTATDPDEPAASPTIPPESSRTRESGSGA